MKSITSYFECEGGGGAIPSNTLGAGNPGLVGPSTLSEPLTKGQIDSTPTAKTKSEDPNTSKTKKDKKKKYIKGLKECINEYLMTK